MAAYLTGLTRSSLPRLSSFTRYGTFGVSEASVSNVSARFETEQMRSRWCSDRARSRRQGGSGWIYPADDIELRENVTEESMIDRRRFLSAAAAAAASTVVHVRTVGQAAKYDLLIKGGRV